MALTCGMFMPAYATEIDDTKKKAEEKAAQRAFYILNKKESIIEKAKDPA